MKTSALLVAVTAAVTHASNPGDVPYNCAKPNANYCLGGDIILRCDGNSIGTPGRCSANLSGYPPAGGVASCWESSKEAGDAACQKNCIVHADPDFLLPETECTPTDPDTTTTITHGQPTTTVTTIESTTTVTYDHTPTDVTWTQPTHTTSRHFTTLTLTQPTHTWNHPNTTYTHGPGPVPTDAPEPTDECPGDDHPTAVPPPITLTTTYVNPGPGPGNGNGTVSWSVTTQPSGQPTNVPPPPTTTGGGNGDGSGNGDSPVPGAAVANHVGGVLAAAGLVAAFFI